MKIKTLYKIKQAYLFAKGLDLFGKGQTIIEKKELQEEYFKDKFFIRIIDKYIKEKFPLGYEVKHSIIKKKGAIYDFHWISIKAKISQNASLYATNNSTDPNNILKGLLQEIEEQKEIYENIKTHSKRKIRTFMVKQIIQKAEHKEHRTFSEIAVKEIMEFVWEQIGKGEDLQIIYEKVINTNYKKFTMGRIRRYLKTVIRDYKEIYAEIRQ